MQPASSLAEDHHWTKILWLHFLVELLFNAGIMDQDETSCPEVKVLYLVLESSLKMLDKLKPSLKDMLPNRLRILLMLLEPVGSPSNQSRWR